MITRTVKELEKYCDVLCATRGHKFDIPIKIDGRLSVTACKFKTEDDGSLVYVLSRKLIDYGEDDTLIGILVFGAATYCSLLESEDPKARKSLFNEIHTGICNATGNERFLGNKIPDSPRMWKYTVRCPRCGRTQGETKRKDIVDHPENWECSCGCKGLEVVQNW